MIGMPVLTLRLLMLSLMIVKRQLIHNRTASRNSWSTNYDFIIVGAGTAGSTVAHRLTENKSTKVLLLEAGGAQSAIYNDMGAMLNSITENKPQLQWVYHYLPQTNIGQQYPGGVILEYTGKTIGGSSSHNNLVFNRGNRRDYDNWAQRYEANGWNYQNVLPFFKKFENNSDFKIVAKNPRYHATNGLIQIRSERNLPQIIKLLAETFNAMGFENTDFNGPKQRGTMIMQSTIDSNGFRSSNGNAYIDPNPHPKNLHIVTKALVLKILFNGLTAIGVEFERNNKLFKVYAQKEVIVSAGPYRSAQLLMLSGIGPKDHLENMGIPVLSDLPVGSNLENHPMIMIRSKVLDSSLFYSIPKLDIFSMTELFYHKRGRLTQNPTNGLYFSSDGNYTNDWPNSLIYSDISNDTFSLTHFLVRVRSRGTVRLQSSNPHIAPIIDARLLTNGQDFQDFVNGVRFAFYVLEKTSIAKYVSLSSFENIGCPVCPNRHMYDCIEGIKCYISYYTTTGSHPCCTCSMGAVDNRDVVVDPYLRVKNLFNLRVCDSSIFPQIPNSNLNSPTTMVAEKCSQIIKTLYKL